MSVPWMRQLWFSPYVLGVILTLRHVIRHRRLPPLHRPVRFNDKVLHRLIFDRRPVLTQLAGKLEARTWAMTRTDNPALLVEMVGEAADAAELAGLDLPTAFIAKANHMSGLTHIHRGPEPPDRAMLTALVADWSARSGHAEWAYQGVKRTVVFEHLMLDGDDVPADFKLFCYAGKVHFVQVDTGRFGDHRQDLMTAAWERMPGRTAYPPSDTAPGRPAELAEMLAVAEQLSAGLDFIRIDLYLYKGAVKLGEITVYPNRGLHWFEPAALDVALGAPWVLSPQRH